MQPRFSSISLIFLFTVINICGVSSLSLSDAPEQLEDMFPAYLAFLAFLRLIDIGEQSRVQNRQQKILGRKKMVGSCDSWDTTDQRGLQGGYQKFRIRGRYLQNIRGLVSNIVQSIEFSTKEKDI